MRTYFGNRDEDEPVVIYSDDGQYPTELKGRGKILLHGLKADEFDWGNDKAATLNLAIQILVNLTDDRLLAIMLCHDFKDTVLSKLPNTWQLTELEILKWAVGFLWSKYRDTE